ncbi:MAG: hypothetical protein FWE54_05210 [Methanimicrococcus sp.]|nr:hypothetical protein [Methanimicrococcus sp.]
MVFRKCKMTNHALRKLEYEYNPVAGTSNIQIKTGSNAKVPINDLSKPCIIEWGIDATAENNIMSLKCVVLFYFKVDGSDDYDIEELRQYVLENGNPAAYKKMTEIVKTITGFSNTNPLILPPYQAVAQKKAENDRV